MLKPFSFERFYRGVLRLYQEENVKPTPELGDMNVEPEYIFLKVGHRIRKVSTRDILFIKGVKDYLRIHTAQEKIMTLLSFAQLEELLPARDFARVHRFFMVSIDKIDHIEKDRIRIAHQTIPISNTYRDGFYKKLRGLG